MTKTTLQSIMSSAPDGPFPVRQAKAWLNGQRKIIMDRIGQRATGHQIAGALSGVVDELVGTLDGGAPGCVIVAVGGYGAGLLAPFSDVDLMVLHDGTDAAAVEARARKLFHGLWDCGIDLGHSVRQIDECRVLMEQDVVIATTLMHARPICGDAQLFQTMVESVAKPFFEENAITFIKAKLEETERRYKQYGDSFCMMEPHAKETKGGLRDFTLALWLERALDGIDSLDALRAADLFPASELDRAATAYDRLWLIRSAMHTVRGMKADRFDVELQSEVAERLGYEETPEAEAMELLMKEYYLGSKAIYRLLRHVVGRCKERIAPTGHLPMKRRLSDSLVLIGNTLMPDGDRFPGADLPRAMMEPFLAAATDGYAIGNELTRAVRKNLYRVDDRFRASAEAAHYFLDLLSGRTGVARALKQMHWAGLLGRYLPEFGDLECLVNYKIFHDYTVDEHTLVALEHIDNLYASTSGMDALKRQVLEQIGNPMLLRLAILMHDAGKSRGPSHEERGAIMVNSLALRLGLGKTDAELLRRLVIHHLLMSRTAGTRDFSDASVVQTFIAEVGDLQTLNLLYLLTYADASAVGRGAWPAWQDVVVAEFYQLSRRELEAPGHPQEPEGDARERILGQISNGALRADAKKHLAMMRDSYLYDVTGTDVAGHLALIDRVHFDQVAVTMRAHNGYRNIWIATVDRPRGFAQLSGTLTLCGFNIVHAQAHTRSDGIVLDRFVVTSDPAHARAGLSRHQLEQRLRLETAEGSALSKKMSDHMRRIRTDAKPPGTTRAQVRIDNKLSTRFTVIDVIASDRAGLLFLLCECLSEQGLDLAIARVATKSNVVTDVFYVTVDGEKLIDPERSESLSAKLLAIVT